MIEQEGIRISSKTGTHTDKCFAYLKVIIFSGLITSLPTLATWKASEYLQLDTCLLFNASGNVIILCRAGFLCIALLLVASIWRVKSKDNFAKLENAIYYLMASKILVSSFVTPLSGYYLLMVPVFTTWFYMRLLLKLMAGLGILYTYTFKELPNLQTRKRLLLRTWVLQTIFQARMGWNRLVLSVSPLLTRRKHAL